MKKIARTLNLIQGSQEWLDARKLHITATEVAHLYSGFTSMYELTQIKRGLIQEKEISNLPPVQEGKFFEPLIRQWFCKTYPQFLAEGEVDLPQPCVESIEEPFFMASLDAFSRKMNCVIEIKNLFHKSSKSFEDIKKNGLKAEIPTRYGYYYQVQWQLALTGAKFGLLIFHHSLDGKKINPNGILIFKIERDEKAIKALIELALKVKAILKSGTEVKPQVNDTVFLTEDKIPDSIKPILSSFNYFDALYKKAREVNDDLKEKRDQLLQSLAENLLKDSNKAVIGTLTLSRVEREGSIDWKAMLSDGVLSKEILDKYRKEAVVSVRASNSH